jgi:hypothetical protein
MGKSFRCHREERSDVATPMTERTFMEVAASLSVLATRADNTSGRRRFGFHPARVGRRPVWNPQ